MQVFDKMTGVVKQGGNRRGANMGVLPYNHPEIREFIRLKSRPGLMENFNISVAVDDKFFEAVENEWEYDLVNPRTQETQGKVKAKDIFDSIIENAWGSGDPGLIFIDRINQSSSNPTPQLGKIESTNPCGEQPLLPNEPCNLGSINLSSFVAGKLTQGTLDWENLKTTIKIAVRFLDNVIDVNNYPLPEMEILAKGNRRIGLGIMGWAETLVKMGTPYDSKEAIALAQEIMKFINEQALLASEELAQERGVFPNWKNSVYDSSASHFAGQNRTPRHSARTTIAPTGTIGLAAGLQGAGIEPFYALAYTRYNAAALENIKNGTAPDPTNVYFEVNPLFRKVAEENNFFGLSEKELWKKIEKNQKSVRGIPEIPEEVQNLFPIAHDISPDFHIKIQAAFQAHTDNAVSKTINMPHSATAQDVRRAYLLAHRLGCKGITIYRDGSKKQQVLNLFTAESQAKKQKRERDLSLGVSSEYYEIKTGHGPLHVHIDYDDAGPYRVFASLPPVGTELAGLTSMIGVLISKFLEEGGDPIRLLKHLQSVKGDRPLGLGKNKINSISHGIAVALRTHLQKHGQLTTFEDNQEADLLDKKGMEENSTTEPSSFELWNLSKEGDQCPECFSTNISFGAGCSGPVCHDCGYSECN
jgi:ribonucleoside-diphosphate reductase alpha chain